MKSVNLHIIKGSLGRDARISKVGERQVANFSVATEYEYKGKDGNWTKETTWHNVTAWQGYGICDFDRLTKGAKVSVMGRERMRTYTDRDGNENSIMELVADTVDILEGDSPAKKPSVRGAEQKSNIGYRDDDLGF